MADDPRLVEGLEALNRAYEEMKETNDAVDIALGDMSMGIAKLSELLTTPEFPKEFEIPEANFQNYWQWTDIELPEWGRVEVFATVAHQEAGIGIVFGSALNRFRRAAWGGEHYGFHWAPGQDAEPATPPYLGGKEYFTFILTPGTIEVMNSLGLKLGSIDRVRTDGVEYLGFWANGHANKFVKVLLVEAVEPPPVPKPEPEPAPAPTPAPTPEPTPTIPISTGGVQWPVEEIQPASGEIATGLLPLLGSTVSHKCFASGQKAIVGARYVTIPPQVKWIKNPEVMDRAMLDAAMVTGGTAQLEPGDFLMLFQPWGNGQPRNEGRFGESTVAHMPYRRAEVYQCVAEHSPTEDRFRPAYAKKSIFFGLAEIEYDVIPSLPVPPGNTRFPAVWELFDRVGIAIGEDWIGRPLHAGENEPNYWREYAALIADALCYLACEVPHRSRLLKGLLQRAIDWYGCMLDDLSDDEVYSADSSLYRVLVSIAGKCFGDSEMEACAKYSDRVERNFYRGTHRSLGETVCFQKDGRKYEHVWSGDWTQRMVTDENYRIDESKAMPGLAAAAKAFGIDHHHPLLMDYAARYHMEGGPVSSEFSANCYVAWVVNG